MAAEIAHGTGESSTGIDARCSVLPGWAGAFPADQIPKNPRGKCFIANYDPSTKPGSHWVAFDARKPDQMDFFGSFGLGPDDADPYVGDETHFAEYIKEHTPPGATAWHNKTDFQNLAGDQCGIWAAYFLFYGRPDPATPEWASVLRLQSTNAKDAMMDSWWHSLPRQHNRE